MRLPKSLASLTRYPDSGYVISKLDGGFVVRPVEPLDNRRWYFDTRSDAHEYIEYLQRLELAKGGDAQI